jgi:hypothetical protein
MRRTLRWFAALGLAFALSTEASADQILFSTSPSPDNAMAMASRPALGGKNEIEAADDFFTTGPVKINSATFTGLITGGGTIGDVTVELYHIFPLDSTVRTPNVPTRTNSPSDVEFDSRDLNANTLTVSTSIIAGTFTANNSVLNGIHPFPMQATMGEGPVTGQEVQFTVTFRTPFTLPDNSHDFFVPQVQVTGGEFYWLSSPRAISGMNSTPFPTGVNDLQAWIRNDALQPDWLRVGTDIVDGAAPVPMFNGTFTLSGINVPEPASWVMAGTAALVGLVGALRVPRRCHCRVREAHQLNES